MASKPLGLSTARVYWKLGQSLLPEHFYAQEYSLRQETHLKFTRSGMPQWGLLDIEWDTFQFDEGILDLKRLVIVMPNGLVIDIPGNTRPAGFNLNSTGTSQLPLYLHLESDFDVIQDGIPSDAGEEGVEKIVHKVLLSSNPYSETAAQTFELGHFIKSVDGTWGLDSAFIPATIAIQNSPFFSGVLERIRATAEVAHQVLVDDIEENYLGGATILSAKTCLRGLYGLKSFLANIDGDMRYHPFELFEALQAFYLDVTLYREKQPELGDLVYRHQELGPLFNRLVHGLEALLKTSRSKTPYSPFEAADGMWRCALPEDIRQAKDVYWLVQKDRVGSVLDLQGFKLAAESRVRLVHQLSLGGIPVERIENPPFHHTFGSEVEFYKLGSGQEWDFAVQDGAVAFFDRPALENTRSFMFWRIE